MALGLLISNSETGHGSIQVAQVNWTLACENGMQTENKVRTPHLTSSRGDADVWSVLSEEAKRADNQSLALKLRDLVRNFASRESFEEILAGMRAAADDVIEGVAVEKSVDKLGAILGVPQKRRSMILEGLIETRGQAGYAGQPVSRATMMNAVTAVANRPDVSLDDVDDWQRLGGRVSEYVTRRLERGQYCVTGCSLNNANPAGAIRQGFLFVQHLVRRRSCFAPRYGNGHPKMDNLPEPPPAHHFKRTGDRRA